MKRFQITGAEYEAIKAKEAATKDKKISRRLQVLMLRHEGKKLAEISEMLKLHRVSITQICQRYREQGLEEFVRNKHESHYRLLSEEKEAKILSRFQSRAGEQVTAREIKEALDAECGRDTGHMYVYNVLKRHGWKKKMPRSRHPKAANEEACEASKKLKPVYWTPKTASQNEMCD